MKHKNIFKLFTVKRRRNCGIRKWKRNKQELWKRKGNEMETFIMENEKMRERDEDFYIF